MFISRFKVPVINTVFIVLSLPTEDKINPSEYKSQDWFLHETTANFDQLPLQYRGICGYTLVKKDGLLIPGVKIIGVSLDHVSGQFQQYGLNQTSASIVLLLLLFKFFVQFFYVTHTTFSTY